MSYRKYINQRGTAERNTRNGRVETPDKFTMFGNIENPNITTNLKDQEHGDGFSPNDVYKMRYDYAMWQQQNDYNEDIYNRYQSPKALMDQYSQAGINPMLVAGGSMPQGSLGSDSVPDSSDVGNYQSSPASSRFSQVLGVIASLFGVGSQISNAITSSKTRRQNQYFQQQELDLKGQQTAAQVAKTTEETKGLEIDNRYKSLEKSLDIAYKAGQITKQEKDIALLDFNVQVNKNVTPEAAAQDILTKYKLDVAEVSKTEAETSNLNALTNKINALLPSEIRNFEDNHKLSELEQGIKRVEKLDAQSLEGLKQLADKYGIDRNNTSLLAALAAAVRLKEPDRSKLINRIKGLSAGNASSRNAFDRAFTDAYFSLF